MTSPHTPVLGLSTPRSFYRGDLALQFQTSSERQASAAVERMLEPS